MRVIFHPEFPKDIRKFEEDYAEISDGLASRFRNEIDDAVEAIKVSPTSAGHFLNLGSIIPSRSDPLTWLTRFRPEKI